VELRQREALDDCLSRLRTRRRWRDRVVGNASRDGSLDIVQRHALAIRACASSQSDNPGCGGLQPEALQPHAPWLAFVNPIAWSKPIRWRGCACASISFGRPARRQEYVDVAVHGQGGDVVPGADLVDGQPARCRRAARDPDRRCCAIGARQLGIAMDPSQPLQAVDAVSGALLLMPRGLFEHGSDEGYRLHAEDPTCAGVRAARARRWAARMTCVVHVRGAPAVAACSSNGASTAVWRYYRRSMQRAMVHRSRRGIRDDLGRFPLAVRAPWHRGWPCPGISAFSILKPDLFRSVSTGRG
jgi:hypothetical protein